MRALNERLTQMQQKNNQDEMGSIDGWPLVDEDTSGSGASKSAHQDNPVMSSIMDNGVGGDGGSGNGVSGDDTDSDKNSADSFVKVPKGTESDPLSD